MQLQSEHVGIAGCAPTTAVPGMCGSTAFCEGQVGELGPALHRHRTNHATEGELARKGCMSFRYHESFSRVTFVAAAVALGGCAGHSDFMTKAPSSYASALAADSATIVFFRDSGVAYAVNFAILDQSANFLGDAVSKSDFWVQVPPGRYFLLAKGGEGTDAVQAEVAAGHVYYVRVVPRMGMWLASVELDPIKPGEHDWSRLSDWLERTNHLAPLVPKAPVELTHAPLPAWAAKTWGGLSAQEQATRTIVPTDGIAFSNNPRLVSSPPVAAAE